MPDVLVAISVVAGQQDSSFWKICCLRVAFSGAASMMTEASCAASRDGLQLKWAMYCGAVSCSFSLDREQAASEGSMSTTVHPCEPKRLAMRSEEHTSELQSREN